MSKHPKQGRDLLAGQGPDYDGFAERQVQAARCADLQAQCARLEAMLRKYVEANKSALAEDRAAIGEPHPGDLDLMQEAEAVLDEWPAIPCRPPRDCT